MALEAINHFKNHAEFLNKAFKTNFKTFTKSRYSYGEHFWVWFINMNLKKNNGWKIQITDDTVCEEYTFDDKRPPYYDSFYFRPEKPYRFIVLFEEKEDGNTYYNLGIYEYDRESSDEYNSKHVFVRYDDARDVSNKVNRHIDPKPAFYRSYSPLPKDRNASYAQRAQLASLKNDTIIEALKKMDKSFSETLLYYIDQKGITDVECYKRANVDRKTFSKIKCNKDYHPSKSTTIAFAIALCLNMEETNHLLRTLGYSLSSSNQFDIIIECCIQKHIYDINMINMILLDFDQPLLGY